MCCAISFKNTIRNLAGLFSFAYFYFYFFFKVKANMYA